MSSKYLYAPWYYLIHEERFVINFRRGRGSSKRHMIELTENLDDARVWKTKRQKDIFVKKWTDTGLLTHCRWIEL